MFSHIMVGANDVKKSKSFYDALLSTLGYKPGVEDAKGRCFYITESGTFALTKPINGEPVNHGNGSTIGFASNSSKACDAWYEAGLANGGTACEEPPGIRAGGFGNLYLAYLRDPAGNKLCVMHRMDQD